MGSLIRKLRILYIVSTLERCGPTNQLYYIIKHLDSEVFLPHILTLSPEKAMSGLEAFNDAGIPVSSLGLDRFRGIVFTRRILQSLLNTIRPDVIHSQLLRADHYSSRAITEAARVSTQRNYPFHDYVMTYGSVPGGIMSRVQYRAFRKLDQVVAVSHTLARLNTKHGVATKVIPNGTDTERYSPADLLERTRLRSHLGLKKEGRVFVTVGSLSVRKDPLVVMDAFTRLADTNCTLLFLGDGALREKVDDAARKDPRVRVIGNTSDVPVYLAASDLFVSASRSEGLPNSVLEALSCGVPVILSDIPQHKEIAVQATESCALFPVGDPDALFALLQQSCVNDTDRLSARRAALENFDARKMSEKYQQLYLELLTNGNVSRQDLPE